MKLAVWGFGRPVIDTLDILRSYNDIEVVYVKADYRRRDIDSFLQSLLDIGYSNVFVEEIPMIEVDLVYLINYNRIIPHDVLQRYKVINYHVGLLPKWRGNSANGWGVINGEDYVGYTIHLVNEMLDDGPILYQFKFPYQAGMTYYDAKLAMADDYKEHLGLVLEQYYLGRIIPVCSKGCDFVYCPVFRPVDGFVNWSDESDMIIRKFFVFAPPLGTGLKFCFKGKEYSITKLSAIPRFAPSVSVPGSVVYKHKGSIWVKTADTAISIDGLECDGEVVNIDSSFIIGQRI